MPSKNQEKLNIMRHSCSHILAEAVMDMFPEAKLGIGPSTEEGFYYDFELPRTLIPEDLKLLEKRMQKIIKQNLPFKKRVVDKTKAIDFFKKAKQSYKVELLKDLPNKQVTFYEQGNFVDLCSGPHLKSTGEIGSFKLLSIAGAYWRGSEKNPMLQRIYGTCFENQKELDTYLKEKEEIEKRDHRKLGKTLDIYSSNDEVGAGLTIWHPNGAIIRGIIEDFWKAEHKKRDYLYLYTPHIGNIGLWKKSGHWEFYREDIYSPIEIDKAQYLLKPMNCPFHVQVFKNDMRSYRDLPIRYAELGTVYRYERAGTLHGLLRVRGFTQDDAHIFCRPDQLEREIISVLDLATFMLKSFGFQKYEIDLSVRDPKNKKKYLGSDEVWKKAEESLTKALKVKKLKFKTVEGEAVFYGPKIDIKLVDSLGRTWQGPTIQVDFNFPEKFDLNYIDEKGKKQRPIMIHRTVLGSMERFIGCLLEHFAGALPVWLSPVQIAIVPVGSKHNKYAKQIGNELEELRVKVDESAESVNKRIRNAEMQKIPYIIVVGDKEIKAKTVTVRDRSNKLSEMKVNKFKEKLLKEINDKK